MELLFIPAGTDVQGGTTPEWRHFANLPKSQLRMRWAAPEGKGILNVLKSRGFSREAAQEMVGSFNGKLDLRGIPLQKENLQRCDLHDVDLFYADLSGTDLSQANLSDSFLSEADLRGTRFDWAKLERVFLDGVAFDHRTSFLGVDLSVVNFALAALLQDLAIAQQRIAHLKKRHPLFAFFLWVTCDYGRSFTRYALWVLSFLIVFAAVYHQFPQLIGPKSFLDSLYFSVVTFATVGYGDIVPLSTAGKIVAILEIMTGYMMGGLLVGILAKRVMQG
jgi:hypothetical protein